MSIEKTLVNDTGNEIGMEGIEVPSGVFEQLKLSEQDYSNLEKIAKEQAAEEYNLEPVNKSGGNHYSPSFKGGCASGCAGTCDGCCISICADSCYNRCSGSYSS